MVSVHSSKTLTETEVGTSDWGIAVMGLTMILFERMWIFGLWIWNSVECFKWGLMGHRSRNMESFSNMPMSNIGGVYGRAAFMFL